MITLYSKPKCVQCDATKRALDKQGTPYTLIDVTQDAEGRATVERLGYRSVPVVVAAEDDHWTGLDLGRIRKLAAETVAK